MRVRQLSVRRGLLEEILWRNVDLRSLLPPDRDRFPFIPLTEKPRLCATLRKRDEERREGRREELLESSSLIM